MITLGAMGMANSRSNLDMGIRAVMEREVRVEEEDRRCQGGGLENSRDVVHIDR